MRELKPFNQQIYYKNDYKQIDCINDLLIMPTMFFQLHPESVKLALKHKIHWKIQSVVLLDVNEDKNFENAL